MTGIVYWRGIALFGLAFSLGAMAQEQPSGSSDAKWGSHVDAGAKFGRRNIGEADLFMPITQNENTLVFTDLRGRFDDQSSNEGNFGIGMRRMQPDGWNFGVYGYFDRRRTGLGSVFEQGTLGAEALGRDWDFRVNGYVPIGSRVQSLGSVSSATISGASVQVTTNMNEERALGGYDAEVGWRVPVFDVENSNQLRLYGGGYWFGDGVLKVTGPRLRAEFAMSQVQGLWKGAELSLGAEAQKDDARGGQTFLSVRLRIPFGGGAEQPRQLTWQERRMTAPLVRDVDIVSQSRVASTLVEAATQTAGGQTITVLNSATTTGAALPGAVAAAPAANAIILSGTFNTTGRTIMRNGQSLMAGSIAVRSASGRTATLTTSATIAGTAGADWVVEMAGNNTLSGLTINGTENGVGLSAVYLDNGSSNITISNNTITATQNGNNGALGINAALVTNLVVSGNTITATGTGTATTMTALGLVLSTGLTVSGNTLSASGGTTNRAVTVTGAGGAGTTINAGSTGNTISAGVCNNGGGTINGSIGFTNGTTCP